MSSISSLTKAMSGLNAAQKGLQVTAHNISNTNTQGYTRQQLLQSDSSYLKIGTSGGNNLKVGTGVSCDEIRQIRDQLADKRLRTENSVLCYYQKLNATTSDIEAIFDEPYGSTVSDFMNNFWSQAQKLSTTPDGVEERMSFISTAQVLMSKINEVSSSLTEYQTKLNQDFTSQVKRVNEITAEIRVWNEKVALAEACGEDANDYRDQRNLLLDELSEFGSVEYFEEADSRVQVKFEGHIVVNKGIEINMELTEISGSPFSKPTWSDTHADVFDMNNISSASEGNDSGSIKALLIARGEDAFNSEMTWADIALNDNFSVDQVGNAYVIPKIQKMLNDFTYELVSLVNETFTGTGIGSHEGKDGVQVFTAMVISDEMKTELNTLKNKADEAGKNVSAAEKAVTAAKKTLEEAQKKLEDEGETAENRKALEDAKKALQEAEENLKDAEEVQETAQRDYEGMNKKFLTAGNIEVNPDLLANGGYNLLGTVAKAAEGEESNADNTGDNSIIKDFLAKWTSTKTWYDDGSSASPYQKSVNLSTFFTELVTDVGTQGAVYSAKASEKNISVTNIENERLAMSGVSTDEEFSSMLKYQYAYNASARMITMLDGMLDTIINKM